MKRLKKLKLREFKELNDIELREVVGGYSAENGYFYYKYDHYVSGYEGYYSDNVYFAYYTHTYFYHYDFVSWGTLQPCEDRGVCGGFCVLGGGIIGQLGVCVPGAWRCTCANDMGPQDHSSLNLEQ
jgi:natural product precursor